MLVNAAKATEAAEVLGVELAALNAVGLGKAYRAAAKTCHPDLGNYSPERWARITWAHGALQKWLTTAPAQVAGTECRACGGSGRIAVRPRGFGKGSTVMCVLCNGKGEA